VSSSGLEIIEILVVRKRKAETDESIESIQRKSLFGGGGHWRIGCDVYMDRYWVFCDPARQSRSAVPSAAPGFVSALANIDIGRELYCNGDLVGTVKMVSDRDVETGTKRQMVLIQTPGGGFEWKTRELVKQYYQVKR